MDQIRKTINEYIIKSGIRTFEIISGLTKEEINMVLDTTIMVPGELLDRVNEAIKNMKRITSQSQMTLLYDSKTRVRPNNDLIAKAKIILCDSRITLRDFAFRISVSQYRLRNWLNGGENRFGWANIENKIAREIRIIKNHISQMQQYETTSTINVQNFVTQYMLATSSSSPKTASKCDNH